jgi:hypothetical protein
MCHSHRQQGFGQGEADQHGRVNIAAFCIHPFSMTKSSRRVLR